jgi:AcrR family transcriptional regulator
MIRSRDASSAGRQVLEPFMAADVASTAVPGEVVGRRQLLTRHHAEQNTEASSVYKGQNAETGAMTDQPAMKKRKPRTDALRNRERVLAAAKVVFSQGGPEASLEAVARQAGVGIGTLYRHFPTREALYEAVYRREVEQLVELARQLGAETAPVEALRSWMRASVEFVATKKGMAAALALAAHGCSDLATYSRDRLTGAVGALLQKAVAAGQIRSDIGPEDLLRALVGMCYAHDQPGWQARVLRLIDVFVDGLCYSDGRPAQQARGAGERPTS